MYGVRRERLAALGRPKLLLNERETYALAMFAEFRWW
jgi:hypothetical protein